MRVENLVPATVARRIPGPPDWVASSPRHPWTAARVYAAVAVAMSTPVLLWVATGNPYAVLYIPLIAANTAGWTWVLWWLCIPASGRVSRGRALGTGFAVGTLHWLTLGPLASTAQFAVQQLGRDVGLTLEALVHPLRLGVFLSVTGFVSTLGLPTVASAVIAYWTLGDERRSGREKGASNERSG